MSNKEAYLVFSDKGDELHETIFQAWKCVVGNGSVIYLSGPITTGRKYVEAITNGLPLDGVLTANLELLASAAAELRMTTGRLVIDPSPLVVAHWSQDQYMRLWRGLIQQHAFEVRFMPDWQYSLGCTMEFVHASHLNIPTLTLGGQPISLIEGRDRISKVLAVLDNLDERHIRLEQLRTGLSGQLDKMSEIPLSSSHSPLDA